MEEEKQRRKEDNKEISSCYQVQQQPAGTVIPEIKCESCGSISEEDVRLCRNEKFLVPDPIWSGGKTTNIVYECNVCETTGTILMVPGEGHPLPSSFGETRKHATIMVFDCDGVEPVSFSLDKTPWEALFNEMKREIHDIYISDGEFAAFHEHDNKIVPVSIWKADAKFVKSE
ncbi:hypothetical protein AAC387_Pa02g0923 [Persea americana]